MLRMFDSLKPMLTGSDLLNKVKELGDVSSLISYAPVATSLIKKTAVIV